MKNNFFRSLFPIFKTNPKIAYFDSAATSLKPKIVIDSINDFYNFNGMSFKNVGVLSQEVYNLLIETRKKTAFFINSYPEEVIFTKGTTESLNMISNILGNKIGPKDEIITSQLEHNSSIFPWMRIAKEKGAKLVFIPLDKNNKITFSNFKKVISDKTKIVVLHHISNVLGYETPIKLITQLAHTKKALVILDAAQSMSYKKINVKNINVDFMAFSAHKMYGPFGVGVLFGKKKFLNKIEPFFVGSMNVEKIFKKKFFFKKYPFKFETGTPNISGIIAFKKSLDFIEKIGFEKIQNHNKFLVSKITENLKKIKNIDILNPNAENNIILCNYRNIHVHDLETFLAKNNVYIRTGQYCADLALKIINSKNTIRISIGIHNNEEDIEILIKSLKEANRFFIKYPIRIGNKIWSN
ncbi:aminotransferase class-V family protein [Candidatus Phytoplasma oryzae]|uniref:cysteine desulfurase n=1 Tax=Candidatus Phytoplasma oryzae TaxID=203274 RepID=A0A139JQ48_9MOLU|nr:aminotransferase class V-fold PLP-dependent enzyme [Candidatus Phytoplasma oryzae]KXT29095.1 aminotransferase class-V family protein [Candidatus Phytoplasma oryzae]KXT29149.1 aminotransferase class-V family protein [Candidatus Phytoplasma oryzae]RAM57726.1 segregation protein B [Candidatus Phytoplasma oryzae]